MKTVRYIYWRDEDMWLGYIEEFPDYMTQGESPEELQENLRDHYSDLSGSKIAVVGHWKGKDRLHVAQDNQNRQREVFFRNGP